MSIQLQFQEFAAASTNPAAGQFFNDQFDFAGLGNPAAVPFGDVSLIFASDAAGVFVLVLEEDGEFEFGGLLPRNDARVALDGLVLDGVPLLAEVGRRVELRAISDDGFAEPLISTDLSASFSPAVDAEVFEAFGAGHAVFIDSGGRVGLHRFTLDASGDGDLTAQGALLDSFNPGVNRLATEVLVSRVGGKVFAHAFSVDFASNDLIDTFEVTREGELRLVESRVFESFFLPGIDGSALANFASLDFGDRTFLVAIERATGITTFEVGHDGRIETVDNAPLSPIDGSIPAIAAGVRDGLGFVVAETVDEFVAFEVGANGALVEVDRLPKAVSPGNLSATRDGILVEQNGRFQFVGFDPDFLFTGPGSTGDPIGALYSIALTEGPNLTFDGDSPFELVGGDRASIGFSVIADAVNLRNDGDREAGANGISFFLSEDELLSFDDVQIGGSAITAKEPGRPFSVSGALDFPVADPGDVFLIAVVDPLSEVEESDEADNVAVRKVQATPFTAGDDEVTLTRASDFDWLALTGRDVVTGTTAADVIFGGGGVDRLFGGAGGDSLHGDGAGDQLFGQGGADALVGGGGRDGLFGGGGRDRLEGGGGNDRLDGDRGADVMNGGAGRDVFVIGRRLGADVIEDFSGRDRLEVESGASRFAQLRIRDAGDDAVISGRGISVRLEGVDAASLDAGDFVFS